MRTNKEEKKFDYTYEIDHVLDQYYRESFAFQIKQAKNEGEVDRILKMIKGLGLKPEGVFMTTEIKMIEEKQFLDTNPRVIYLRSLGYKFDTWEGYAWAEINEMNNKVA